MSRPVQTGAGPVDVLAKLAEIPARRQLAAALLAQSSAKVEEIGASSPGREDWNQWPERALWYFWKGVEDACQRECERINRQWGQLLGQRDRTRRAALAKFGGAA